MRSDPSTPDGGVCSTELEACSVCLDSLCSAPVTILLSCGDGAPGGAPKRVCAHYIHVDCAERLAPSKCPLCRLPFTAVAAPIDRSQFVSVGCAAIIEGLGQLAGLGAGMTRIPARLGAAFLAATLPVTEEAACQALQQQALVGQRDGIDSEVLGMVLQQLGMSGCRPEMRKDNCFGEERAEKVSSLLRPGYSFLMRTHRRLNWVALKAAGAAGAAMLLGCCGMGIGMLAGGCVAVPRHQLPDLRGDDQEIVVVLKVAWLICLAAYHGVQRVDLVLQGLSWGACAGALAGWFHALVVVNPERHGFRSVFWAGFTGEATLGAWASWLRGRSASPRRTQIFGLTDAQGQL